MKSLSKVFVPLVIIPMLFIIGCKDDDEITPVSNFETLTTYMVNNNLDLPDVLDGWIVAPPSEADLNTFLSTYEIFDVRSATDFAAGHIEGAINTTFSTLLSDAANTTKPILMVCYTGQSAGHAVVALRLTGFEDAKVLKWGMSGWNSNFSAPWEGNSGSNGNHGVGHGNWTTSSTAIPQTFSPPTWTSINTDQALLLRERVQIMLQKGFQGVSCSDVLTSPNQYFINNYWAEADVTTYGHINGAYRIFPMSIASGELENLNPNATIATYCWTGQTSSMVTAYLTVLGYNAKSMKFGVNNMIYSDLQGHKFTTPTVDLPVVN